MVLSNSIGHFNSTVPTNFTANLIPDAFIFSLIGSYTVVGPFGLIGNLLVILTVWKNNRMRNSTNFLLVNVAISDFIFILATTPSYIIFLLSSKIFTSTQYMIVVKLLFSTQIIYIFFSTISSISLAMLAVERYNAMVHPLKIHRRLTKRGTKIVICLTWITATVLVIPLIVRFVRNLEVEVFHELKILETRIHWIILLLIMLVIPVGVVAFCYGRIMIGIYVVRNICSQRTRHPQDRANRKKLTNMLLLVSLVFITGHTPVMGTTIHYVFESTYDFNVLVSVLFLHHLSPCLNPIIYVVYNTNYREGVKRLLRRNNRPSSSDFASTSRAERSQNDTTFKGNSPYGK